jgi:rhomboid family GlyGly-CTERM serine protease
MSLAVSTPAGAIAPAPTSKPIRSAISRGELITLAALLLLANLPLFFGSNTDLLAFDAAAVRHGEWWRLVTHPFAHISLYHFLLDGAAFLFLCFNLPPMHRWERVFLTAAAGAGSLIVSLAFSPLIGSIGLRGLSGIAHGLMAAGALAGLADRNTRTVSAATFLSLAAKCVYENIVGTPLFEAWHLGSIGTPIVTCHTGGLLGGALAWFAISSPRKAFV